MITQQYLKSRLRYDPETGHFVWISCPHRNDLLGKVAGATQSNGYVYIMIDDKSYLAHRLAFLYIYGVLPKFLDHINRAKDDNRIVNLRKCTHSQNLANSKHRKSSTGIRGVYHNGSGGFKSLVMHNGKPVYLGTFKTPEDASAAYQKKKIELFGEFAIGL